MSPKDDDAGGGGLSLSLASAQPAVEPDAFSGGGRGGRLRGSDAFVPYSHAYVLWAQFRAECAKQAAELDCTPCQYLVSGFKALQEADRILACQKNIGKKKKRAANKRRFAPTRDTLY